MCASPENNDYPPATVDGGDAEHFPEGEYSHSKGFSGWTSKLCEAHKGDAYWNGTCTDCRTVWVDAPLRQGQIDGGEF